MKFIASAAPIWARVLRKLKVGEEINDIAAEHIEICAAETTEERPAIALPDEFDRVLKPRHNISIVELAAAVAGGPTMHGPTVAYRFRDVLLADGSIYVGFRYEQVAKFRRRPIIFGHFPEYETAQLCADSGSDIFFGHWLCDSLAKEMLAKERGLRPLNQPNDLRIHEQGYRSILGMTADMPQTAYIRDLWTVDDRGYNSDHVRRFRALRTKLRETREAETKASRLIYLGRGRTGESGRNLQNEQEIQAALDATGFDAIHPEEIAPPEIRDALMYARIVVSVEGSALAHAVLALPEGSAIVVIQPANRFSHAFKSVSEFAGIRFAYIVAEQRGTQLWLDPARLIKLIEMVDGQI